MGSGTLREPEALDNQFDQQHSRALRSSRLSLVDIVLHQNVDKMLIHLPLGARVKKKYISGFGAMSSILPSHGPTFVSVADSDDMQTSFQGN